VGQRSTRQKLAFTKRLGHRAGEGRSPYYKTDPNPFLPSACGKAPNQEEDFKPRHKKRQNFESGSAKRQLQGKRGGGRGGGYQSRGLEREKK